MSFCVTIYNPSTIGPQCSLGQNVACIDKHGPRDVTHFSNNGIRWTTCQVNEESVQTKK